MGSQLELLRVCKLSNRWIHDVLLLVNHKPAMWVDGIDGLKMFITPIHMIYLHEID